TFAMPISGGAPQKICIGGCAAFWSSDGRFFYYRRALSEKTLVVHVPAGKSLPDLPSPEISTAAKGAGPRATVLEHSLVGWFINTLTYFFYATRLSFCSHIWRSLRVNFHSNGLAIVS